MFEDVSIIELKKQLFNKKMKDTYKSNHSKDPEMVELQNKINSKDTRWLISTLRDVINRICNMKSYFDYDGTYHTLMYMLVTALETKSVREIKKYDTFQPKKEEKIL